MNQIYTFRDFVQAAFSDVIKPYKLSQDLPKDWDKAPVKVVSHSLLPENLYIETSQTLMFFFGFDRFWSATISRRSPWIRRRTSLSNSMHRGVVSV